MNYSRAPEHLKNVEHTATYHHTTGETVTIRVAVQATSPLGNLLQARINADVARCLAGVEPNGFTRLNYTPHDLPELVIVAPEQDATPAEPPAAVDPGVVAPTPPVRDQAERPRRKAADRVREA